MTQKQIYELDFTERKVLTWTREIFEELLAQRIFGMSLETGEIIDGGRYTHIIEELKMITDTTTIFQTDKQLCDELY